MEKKIRVTLLFFFMGSWWYVYYVFSHTLTTIWIYDLTLKNY